MIFNRQISFLNIIFTFFLVKNCQLKELPEYILPCSKTDPELNTCIRNSFHHLRKYLPNGLPDLGVPPLEPLVVEELVMENNAGAVRVKARFSNIVSKGASNYTIKEVRNDIKKLRIDFSLYLPRVEVTGNYDVNGNVLLLPVRTNGNFWAEFSDVSVIAKVYGQERKRDNGTFMHIAKLIIDFTMKNAKFNVEDKVNAKNILGEAINQFLNQNAKELIKEMRPAASKSISKLFLKILNGAFSQIEINDWLLE